MFRWIALLSIGIIVFSACHRSKVQTSTTEFGGGSEKFYASKWEIREVGGIRVIPSTSIRPGFLLFSPGQISTVTGSTGCNRLSGKFDLMGTNEIKFSPLITTKMACSSDANNIEQRVLAALSKAKRYRISDTSLEFFDDTDGLIKLAAVPNDTTPAN